MGSALFLEGSAVSLTDASASPRCLIDSWQEALHVPIAQGPVSY